LNNETNVLLRRLKIGLVVGIRNERSRIDKDTRKRGREIRGEGLVPPLGIEPRFAA
jgi:hypothetical protein